MDRRVKSVNLFPYQQTGAAFLAARPRALLADEPGLGKSAQAIAGADDLLAGAVVVVCPAVGRINWLREFSRFSKLPRPAVAIMTKRDRPIADGVTVVSWDLLAAMLPKLPPRIDALILDESHYAKSRAAKRSRAAWKLVERSAAVWCLSGTPAPNDPSELYPMLRAFKAVGYDYWTFVRKFCQIQETPFGAKILGGRNLGELRQLLAPIMLRRKKEEVMKDLPPIRFSDVAVEAEPFDHELVFPQYFMGPGFQDRALAERTLAEEVAKQNAAVQALWDVGVDAKGRLAALEGLAGSTATLRRYTAMSKVGAVAKLLDQELIERQYDKVVVFAIHKDPIDTLREALKRHGAVALYGGTPPTKRQRNIDKFQNDPKCRVFVGQVTAAGTLITLTAANQVVFLESSWTPADNAQAAMRCHRIGQTRPVFVRVIGLAGSIDEQVQATLRRKTATLTQLFDKQED